jgi:hypothetical protein
MIQLSQTQFPLSTPVTQHSRKNLLGLTIIILFSTIFIASLICHLKKSTQNEDKKN